MPPDAPKRVIHARDVSFSVQRVRVCVCTGAHFARISNTRAIVRHNRCYPWGFLLFPSRTCAPLNETRPLRESTYQCLSKEDKDGDRQIDTENGWRGGRMYNGEKLVPKVAAFSGNP